MRIEEAQAIGQVLAGLPDDNLAPVLNLGSGSGYFRKEQQPHIDHYMFAPLEARGIECIHVDIRAEAGIDLIGNLVDPDFQSQLRALNPGCILLNNFLEHVTDPLLITQAIEEFLPSGGAAIVSVPFSYPYHLDPIDTGLRPMPEEIAALFAKCDLVEGRVISSARYIDRLKEMSFGELIHFSARSSIRFLTPFYRYDAWKARFHRFFWLFRPYKVSMAVLRKR